MFENKNYNLNDDELQMWLPEFKIKGKFRPYTISKFLSEI